MIYEFLSIYLFLINVVGIFLCIKDKHAAKTDCWRVKESTFFNLCIFGASIGIYLCMKLIRHKTKHKKFMIGIPVIMVFQLILLLVVILHI